MEPGRTPQRPQTRLVNQDDTKTLGGSELGSMHEGNREARQGDQREERLRILLSQDQAIEPPADGESQEILSPMFGPHMGS